MALLRFRGLPGLFLGAWSWQAAKAWNGNDRIIGTPDTQGRNQRTQPVIPYFDLFDPSKRFLARNARNGRMVCFTL